MTANEIIKKLSLERCRLALSMRRDGKTLQQIGDHFGFSRERARQLICKAERAERIAALRAQKEGLYE